MQSSMLAGALILSTLSLEIGALDSFAAKRHHHHYSEIQTEELKDWYDQDIEMTVIDVRSAKYFSGILLPEAIWLPFDAEEAEVRNTLPSKDALIVVYCLDSECPMGRWMAERLTSEGYIHVYKYTDGLKVWMEHGYPTD